MNRREFVQVSGQLIEQAGNVRRAAKDARIHLQENEFDRAQMCIKMARAHIEEYERLMQEWGLALKEYAQNESR